MKSGDKFYMKDSSGNEIDLPTNTTYNIYNYNSKKAFMLRITTQTGTHYCLSPDINMKSSIADFFAKFQKKTNRKDTYVRAYPYVICFAYVIISIVFGLFI